ncbi:hypothetical protein NPIL_251441 [Nephila pilipes]|uniref:Uncharacterized protein n=1 Tax=Nephila pilipes TaxID=299642 RepID=A0A8X6MXS7_NEPPI|nr:hypothetical protein NPIL_251441 [Nephila pilipes]
MQSFEERGVRLVYRANHIHDISSNEFRVKFCEQFRAESFMKEPVAQANVVPRALRGIRYLRGRTSCHRKLSTITNAPRETGERAIKILISFADLRQRLATRYRFKHDLVTYRRFHCKYSSLPKILKIGDLKASKVYRLDTRKTGARGSK